MSVTSDALLFQQLVDEHAAWRLLRAANAPVILAILDNHLGGQTRRLPTFELANLVEADLEELRLRTSLDLPRSAQDYCDQWRTAGFLVRRPSDQPRIETYELSAAAVTAIQFARGIAEPQRTATQSRLSTIIEAIQRLARDTDEDITKRKAALMSERDAIDEALKRLDEGIIETLENDRAVEQARDIMSIARQIPADFLTVTAEFEVINEQLHASILNSDDESAQILEDIFAGVDHIEQSSSGRSFGGFFSLLRDPALTESVQAALDDILSRPFAHDLTADERHRLRNLLRSSLNQSFEVHGVMTQFAQGLRRFVQEQSYQEQRQMKRLIDQTLALAHNLASEIPLNHEMLTRLSLTHIKMQPITRWQPHNPGLYRSDDAAIEPESASPKLSIEDLRKIVRESEIDYRELLNNVNAALSMKETVADEMPTVSLAEVLNQFPATQGVASVVGLVDIATRQGRQSETRAFETVHWERRDGARRKATIPAFEFYREVTL